MVAIGSNNNELIAQAKNKLGANPNILFCGIDTAREIETLINNTNGF